MTYEELEQKVSEQGIKIEELTTKLDEAVRLLEDHAHQGGETLNLQDIIKQLASIDVKVYKSEGTAGLKQVISVRNAADSGYCTITVVNGIITATTCS